MSCTDSVNLVSVKNPMANAADNIAKGTLDQPVTISSAFISLLAHEVRNPLMNINLSVKLLELNIKDADGKEYIDIIKRSCSSINHLVATLIQDNQLIKTAPAHHSIQQMLDTILDNSTDRIFLKHVAVTKTYSSEDLNISENNEEIKIALTNIIINAIEAMPANGGHLLLTTRFIQGKYMVKIEDNGCGIKKENLKNIFDPYYTNKGHGLGVGLSLTHDILSKNSIVIAVRSKEGCGTCFTLLFGGKSC